MAKKTDIKDVETKAKKKTKAKEIEPLNVKVESLESNIDMKETPIEVEIDCRSDTTNHSDVVGGYIRRKRSI